MPWGLAAAAISAGGAYASSSSAAGKGQKAADASLAEQQRQYNINQQNQRPWIDAGTNALQNLTQLSGQFGKMPTAADVMATPGYQFGLNQGSNALQGGAAARGGLYSGAAGKALTQFGNDYGTTKYNDAFNRQQSGENAIWNRYAGLAGVGQSAVNQVGASGQNYANQVGNILQGNANFQGAAGIAGMNQALNGVNSGLAAWGRNNNNAGNLSGTVSGWWGNMWGNNEDPSNKYAQNGSDVGMKMADGGPVSRANFDRAQLQAQMMNGEPVVGSRSQVRTGGGGGLTPNALLQLLQQQAQQPQVPRSGVALLQANPVVDPQAILMERMRQAGAYAMGGEVHGPGGPRDDEVPAMLSDGEQVITAKAVRGAGNGNREKGHAALNKLQALLERRA